MAFRLIDFQRAVFADDIKLADKSTFKIQILPYFSFNLLLHKLNL